MSMHTIFQAFIRFIGKYFWVVFLLAVALGLTLPEQMKHLYPLLTPLIIVVMYLGAIDIEYHKLHELKNYWKSIILYCVVMMIVLPIVLYFWLSRRSPDIATGVFLLAAAPAGIATIAFVRMMWWNALLALCIAVITTAMLPITLPLMSEYIVGSTIAIDIQGMFIDLILFCILPLLWGYLTQRYMRPLANALHPHIDRFSIVLIWLMIAWPVAYNADLFLSIWLWKLLAIVWWLFILSWVLHIVWWICFGNNRPNNIAWSLAKWFMNISVTTVIAAKYFSPAVLIIVLLYEFPRDLMLIPFAWVVKKMKNT